MTSDGISPGADLAWANALEAAVRSLGRRADEIDADTQCAVSQALAAAILSLAADAVACELTWPQIAMVARAELRANATYRNAHPLHA